MQDNDIVVTGMGIVSPIGNDLNSFKEHLFALKSGAEQITRFKTFELPTKIACEVKNFPSTFRDIKIDFALSAAEQAIQDSKIHIDSLKTKKTALSIGIGLEVFALEDVIHLKNNPDLDCSDKNKLHLLNTPSDLCCHLISKKYNFNQAPLIHISACAAGSDAIGSAYLQLKLGEADFVLAGGTDSMINPMGIAGFSRISAMTTKNETPSLASQPFNKNRDGFVIGEGSGFITMERYSDARARGAKILAQISGYGNSLDAYSPSDPHPKGAGALLAMKRALKSASLDASELSAVSAHATGTPKNDPAESAAIKSLLGANYKNIPVMATKSLIGHGISAAGAMETIAAIICLQNNELHATKNLTTNEIDPECDLSHIIGENKKIELKHILKNSFGFGGQNACLIISKVKS